MNITISLYPAPFDGAIQYAGYAKSLVKPHTTDAGEIAFVLGTALAFRCQDPSDEFSRHGEHEELEDLEMAVLFLCEAWQSKAFHPVSRAHAAKLCMTLCWDCGLYEPPAFSRKRSLCTYLRSGLALSILMANAGSDMSMQAWHRRRLRCFCTWIRLKIWARHSCAWN
jgi:hypothetical protein